MINPKKILLEFKKLEFNKKLKNTIEGKIFYLNSLELLLINA